MNSPLYFLSLLLSLIYKKGATDAPKTDEKEEPNAIDDHYKKLNCDISYVDPNVRKTFKPNLKLFLIVRGLQKNQRIHQQH